VTIYANNEALNAQPITLYTFIRGDQVWAYTDQPEDVTTGGVTYRAASITHDALEQSDESAGGEFAVTMAEVTPIVADLDALGLSGRPVTCTVRAMHKVGVGGVSSSTAIVRRKGAVMARTIRGGACTMKVASLTTLLDRPILSKTCGPTCQWTVYGVGCGVDPVGFTTTGCAVSAISGRTLTVSDAASQADDYYTAGYAVVETGTAIGERLQIASHTGDQLVMLTELPPGLTTSDTVAITAGCDGLEATCDTKFANLDYFLGFPRVPTVNPFLKVE
jgi:uncharacterized phage protein (TIGR02218 family)